jgi:hypothetical protein
MSIVKFVIAVAVDVARREYGPPRRAADQGCASSKNSQSSLGIVFLALLERASGKAPSEQCCLMRPSRKHYAIGKKTLLQSWKFIKGDHVQVTTGRSAEAPEKKGYKGAKGYIERVNRDHRNPTVEISNVTVCS